jgi:hypothetical protein
MYAQAKLKTKIICKIIERKYVMNAIAKGDRLGSLKKRRNKI